MSTDYVAIGLPDYNDPNVPRPGDGLLVWRTTEGMGGEFVPFQKLLTATGRQRIVLGELRYEAMEGLSARYLAPGEFEFMKNRPPLPVFPPCPLCGEIFCEC